MIEPRAHENSMIVKRVFPGGKILALPGFVSLILVSIFACSSDFDITRDVSHAKNLREPKIQFLGVGGWLLHWHGEGVLTAPSFSNPESFKGLPPLRVQANKKRIDDYMPPADDVTMLLVGHGHYDHLLDVPWVMRKYATNSTVYGSDTVQKILLSMKDANRVEDENFTWVDPERVVNVMPQMAKVPNCDGSSEPATNGEWITSTGGYIRALPIQSMHASHILGHTFAGGPQSSELTEVPISVFQWKQGQSLAWLIELLEDCKTEECKNDGGMIGKTVAYRIHFQDSAANPPCGLPPKVRITEAVDVEILSVGSWHNTHNYPNELLKLTRPKLILLGHWENFFGNDPGGVQKALNESDITGMRDAIESVLESEHIKADVNIPLPLHEVALPTRQE